MPTDNDQPPADRAPIPVNLLSQPNYVPLDQHPAPASNTAFKVDWTNATGSTGFSLVQAMHAYDDGNRIVGFLLEYTDGSMSRFIGNFAAHKTSITFAPGETIEKILAWVSSDAIGGLEFHTSQQRTLVGVPTTLVYPWISKNALLAGFEGTVADTIASIRPLLLGEIASVYITDMRLNTQFAPNGTPSSELIGQSTVGVTKIVNKSKAPTSWKFEGSVTRTISQKWEQSSTTQLSNSVSVSAGFFDIVKVNDTFTWTKSSENSTSSSTSEEVEIGWDVSGELPAEVGAEEVSIFCQAVVASAQVDIPYRAAVYVIFGSFNDGVQPDCFSFYENGVLRASQFSSAFVTVSATYPTGEVVILADRV